MDLTDFRADSPLPLDLGGDLPPVTVAYETWGTFDGANAVLVCHALTGDSHAGGEGGWWAGAIGAGLGIDTDRWFVVCPNVLGGCRGTTGPSTFPGAFPRITIRDQVAVEAALSDHLGIEVWAAVVGGSMGGMRALEWAVTHPGRLERCIVAATTAAASAEQIALCAVQIEAIRADPASGMGLARKIGHLSYRSETELAVRFGRAVQDGEDPLAGGRYAVESYLDHHALKLDARFDPGSYVVLSEAMNHHDVGRGRGGVAAALACVTARVAVAGIDSDRLYPLYQQRDLAALLPGAPEVTVIHSDYGHDGFLIEVEAVGEFIRNALREGGDAP